MLLLVLALSILGVANHSMRVHSMAQELTRFIEVRGKNDAAVQAELARLTSASGLNVTCNIATTYLSHSQNIQYGDEITVTLRYTTQFGVGGVLSVPITMHSTVSGRSEVYWK